MTRRLILATIALAISTATNADDFGPFNHPGGIVDFLIEKQSDQLPEVKYGLSEPIIIDQQDHWRVLIGISLDTLPGEYVVYYKAAFDGVSGEYKTIEIQQKDYAFIERDVEPQFTTQPSSGRVFSVLDYANTQQPELPFSMPVDGQWSDSFGHKIFNTQSQQVTVPHSLNLISANELVVRAPQNAIVSKLVNNDSGPSTITLDHGRGLYSVISGLSDVTVNVGNGIVAGAVIGRLTVTDLDSARQGEILPLQWQTVMNNAYIDPRILTQIR